MENTIKTAISYCKNQASYSYLKDTITTFIENKKEIKNQTQTIEMICGDLFNIQCLFNN